MTHPNRVILADPVRLGVSFVIGGSVWWFAGMFGCSGKDEVDASYVAQPDTEPVSTGATADTADTDSETVPVDTALPPLAHGSWAVGDLAFATIGGADGWNIAGRSFGPGDLDGDGHDDLVIGAAPFGANDQTGYVWVFRGPITSDLTIADADLTLAGEAPGHNAGFWIAPVPDTDGDGLTDLVLAATNDDAGVNTGAIYVVPGTGSGPVSLENALAEIHGEAFDLLGSLGLDAGELTGDAFGDVIASAQSGSTTIGYLFPGPVAGQLSASAGTLVYDDGALLYPYARMTVGGDLDGDGSDDVMVLAHSLVDQAPATTGVFVFHGPILADTPTSSRDAQILGDPGAMLASAVPLGDTDGDGYDDLLFASPYTDYGATSYLAGRAWVVLGPVTGGDLATVADVVVDGDVPGSFFGMFADRAGDLDGDDLPDWVVGADAGGFRTYDSPGRAYVFLSPSTGHIDAADATTIFEPEWDRQRLGSQVAGLRDIDGDGGHDLLVSATSDFETDDIDSAGTAYLFSGTSWR